MKEPMAGSQLWSRSPFSLASYLAAVALLAIGVAARLPFLGLLAVGVAARAVVRREPLARAALVLAILLVPAAIAVSAIS